MYIMDGWIRWAFYYNFNYYFNPIGDQIASGHDYNVNILFTFKVMRPYIYYLNNLNMNYRGSHVILDVND